MAGRGCQIWQGNEIQIDPDPLKKEISSDSEKDSKDRAAQGYTKHEKISQIERGTIPLPTSITKKTKQNSNGKETGGANQLVRRKQGDDKSRPAENPLISAFVCEMSPLLGDRSTLASETYLLRLTEKYGLSHSGDALDCLVRAYVEAQRTTARHRDPVTGQELKMPLFNFLFKSFANAWSQGNWSYTEDDLIADIQSDEWLRAFVLSYQQQHTVQEAASGVVEVPLASFTFEELQRPAPAAWMEQQKEAEALMRSVEKEVTTLQGIKLIYVIIHRCRSLRGKTVFVVEVEFEAEHLGQVYRFQDYYASLEQWHRYYEEQKDNK